MDYTIMKKLIDQGESTWSIGRRMGRHQSTVRYWLKKYGLTTRTSDIYRDEIMNSHKCPSCGKLIQGKRFCDHKCKSIYYSHLDSTKSSRKRASQKLMEKRKNRRRDLVIESGGECIVCGYNKNFSALTFHHRDSSTKNFPLDVRNICNRRIESVRDEAKKCDLLCSNCHQELHHPSHNILDMKSLPSPGFEPGTATL